MEYEIRTIDDLSGSLVFTQTTEPARDRGEIVLFCRIGDFGDRAREQRVVREVADRLRQLRGVDFAPSR